MTKSRHFEFAAPVERWLKFFDRLGIVDVKLSVTQTRKVGTLAHGIVARAGAGAADMHARALGPERLRYAVADAAGATNDKNLLCAEIQFVHLPAILFL